MSEENNTTNINAQKPTYEDGKYKCPNCGNELNNDELASGRCFKCNTHIDFNYNEITKKSSKSNLLKEISEYKKTILSLIIFLIICIAIFLFFKIYTEYAKNKSLEEHFGSIELSDEEMEKIARDTILGDDADKLENTNKTLDETDISKNSLYSVRDDIEKTVNTSIGTLSDNEKIAYINLGSQFVSSLKDFLEKNFNSTKSSISMLFSDDDTLGNELIEDTAVTYQSELSDTNSYGEQLIESIHTGLEDNILSDTEISIIKQNLTPLLDIVDKHKQAEIEAENEVLNKDIQ